MVGESIRGDIAVDDESGMKSEANTVVLVSPAMAESNSGNWHTAKRWAQFLSDDCDIALLSQWRFASQDPAAHTLIALHARRSAPSIQAWAQQCPGKPLIVVLTGTDLYRDIHVNASAWQSLALASHLVVLQEAALDELPPAFRSKAQVIYQSAPALKPAIKATHRFRALFVGHLREEKDPLTYLRAAARVSQTALAGSMRFDLIGRALERRFANAASTAQAGLPHCHWWGDLPRARTRQHIKRAHVLVNSSLMEGGAQVILEAVQSGTPVLASRISGNLGMLGADYAGYFAAGDDAALARLLQRCATEHGFLALLEKQCSLRAPLFSPDEEKRRVINLASIHL